MSGVTEGEWIVSGARRPGYEAEVIVKVHPDPRATEAITICDIRKDSDARLLAASKDLLTALLACRRQMQNEWHNKPRIGMEAECALADAAIARARGLAP